MKEPWELRWSRIIEISEKLGGLPQQKGPLPDPAECSPSPSLALEWKIAMAGKVSRTGEVSPRKSPHFSLEDEHTQKFPVLQEGHRPGLERISPGMRNRAVCVDTT